MTLDPTPTGSRSANLLAAALLAVPAVLTVVLILHHPALHGRHGVEDVAVGIGAVAQVDRIVHGGLITAMSIQTLGFYLFSTKLGWARPAVAAGFMAYAAGMLLMVIPTVLDGFVTPDLAAACLASAKGCAATDGGAFRLVAVMIQDFTKAALMAMSAGIFCWALALLFGEDALSRGAGVIGLLCAATPVAILLFSDIYLRPGNLAGMIASQVVWSLLIAALMVSGDRALSRVSSAAA